MKVSADDQVKAYIKKIMSQLNRWMAGGKISKLVVVITDRDTGEHVERWQFDVRTEDHNCCPQAFLTCRLQVEVFGKSSKSKSAGKSGDKENAAPR
jgi:mitotic spindle assembly checkpoint protein MAD2